jgi:FtsZ-interacting cell division protein ZipA
MQTGTVSEPNRAALRWSLNDKEAVMAAWIWILIAIGVVVVLALVVVGALRGREKTQRREKAQELRQQADTHRQQAEERERVAQEQVQQARESRRVAAEVGARADRIDPDREQPEDEG